MFSQLSFAASVTAGKQFSQASDAPRPQCLAVFDCRALLHHGLAGACSAWTACVSEVFDQAVRPWQPVVGVCRVQPGDPAPNLSYILRNDWKGTISSMRSIITACDKEIRVQGRLLRIAQLEADGYFFLDEPEILIQELRRSKTRIDLFTFMQRLPETTPKFNYPMELDNLAVLPVSTFDHWWNHQIRSFPRNRARQAEKRGVVLREVPFDESL